MLSQKRGPLTAAIALSALMATTLHSQTPLKTVLLQGGFTAPVWAGSPPGDKHRIFVIEQHTGRIEILKDGVLLAAPFVTVSGMAGGNEQGLLSMAFDPNYEVSGLFYVYFTATGGTINIRRYHVNGDPMVNDVADASSATTMLTIPHPTNTNHNGGLLQFGPDGYLYSGQGDGGSGNDPPCNAQNKMSLLGKMLRLDVSTVPASAPATNPFVGNTAFNPLIYNYGLRNPWRWDFDPATGDLFIADVGQNLIEEVDWVASGTTGGRNFGWRVMEGNNCTGLAACQSAPLCNDPSFTYPVLTYSHTGGACSITGGVVYRGCAIPDLAGTYFFADYCTGKIQSFKIVGGAVSNLTDRTAELDPAGALAINNPVSFGRDACGEILIVDQTGGELYKIVPTVTAMADLGGGKVGGNGRTPYWFACGQMGTGQTADYQLLYGPPSRPTLLFLSFTQGATPFFGGTLTVGFPIVLTVPLFTDANGEINIPAVAGGGGPVSFYSQWAIDDPGASGGVGLSNGIRVDLQP